MEILTIQNQRLIHLYKLEYLNIPNNLTANNVIMLFISISIEKQIKEAKKVNFSFKNYMLNKY